MTILRSGEVSIGGGVWVLPRVVACVHRRVIQGLFTGDFLRVVSVSSRPDHGF